jgi:hypothetical protein
VGAAASKLHSLCRYLLPVGGALRPFCWSHGLRPSLNYGWFFSGWRFASSSTRRHQLDLQQPRCSYMQLHRCAKAGVQQGMVCYLLFWCSRSQHSNTRKCGVADVVGAAAARNHGMSTPQPKTNKHGAGHITVQALPVLPPRPLCMLALLPSAAHKLVSSQPLRGALVRVGIGRVFCTMYSYQAVCRCGPQSSHISQIMVTAPTHSALSSNAPACLVRTLSLSASLSPQTNCAQPKQLDG